MKPTKIITYSEDVGEVKNMPEVGYFKTASDAVKTIQFYATIIPDFHCTLKRVKVKLLGIYPVWVLRRWTK